MWFPVSYRSCVTFTVTPTGLALSIFFPFRLLSPPLFIPWRDVESVTEGRFPFVRCVTLRIRNHWSQIRVYGGNLSREVVRAFEEASPKNAL
jgi:hypothetical protein